MIEQHTEEEQTLRAISHFYTTQVSICIAALGRMRSAELADKNIILRAIMCDMPDCGICADPTAEDYGVDFWVDRAEYVDDLSFNLYVTQAEENVLWNIEKKGQKPGRLAAPQQRITVRTDGISRPPYIPGGRTTQLAPAMSDVRPETDLSTYDDERMMAAMSEHMTEALDRIVAMQNGEEDAQMPVS